MLPNRPIFTITYQQYYPILRLCFVNYSEIYTAWKSSELKVWNQGQVVGHVWPAQFFIPNIWPVQSKRLPTPALTLHVLCNHKKLLTLSLWQPHMKLAFHKLTQFLWRAGNIDTTSYWNGPLPYTRIDMSSLGPRPTVLYSKYLCIQEKQGRFFFKWKKLNFDNSESLVLFQFWLYQTEQNLDAPGLLVDHLLRYNSTTQLF